MAQKDYFEPTDYDKLNTDVDFGASGIALLDPTVFSGGGVARIGVAMGKNGKVSQLLASWYEAQHYAELTISLTRSMSWMQITSAGF
jgi:hypothetical protein